MLILFRLDGTFLFCNMSLFVFVFYDTFMFFFCFEDTFIFKILSLCLVCVLPLLFFEWFQSWMVVCLWFGYIVTMEMQSRDYYYHFQTYLPTLSSGLLPPRNIKSNRYGLGNSCLQRNTAEPWGSWTTSRRKWWCSSSSSKTPCCLFFLYLYPLSAPFLNPLSSPFPHFP